MYIDVTTQTPQEHQLRFLQYKRNQYLLLIKNLHYTSNHNESVLQKAQYKTLFNSESLP